MVSIGSNKDMLVAEVQSEDFFSREDEPSSLMKGQ